MTKYYSSPADEGLVFAREHFQLIAEDQQQPVIVEGMKREVGGEKWCKINSDFVETRDCCGNQCKDYDPCNKVSGRCRGLVAGFIGTGIKYRITGKGSVRRVS